jgi:hypothetical protein
MNPPLHHDKQCKENITKETKNIINGIKFPDTNTNDTVRYLYIFWFNQRTFILLSFHRCIVSHFRFTGSDGHFGILQLVFLCIFLQTKKQCKENSTKKANQIINGTEFLPVASETGCQVDEA